LIKKGNATRKSSMAEEVSMTQVFQVALQRGLKIDTVTFEEGSFMDIGSPENLKKAAQSSAEFAYIEENK
jgi:dTDP-glucose pyrophosphorylase